MKKFIKIVLFVFLVLSFFVGGYSGYWLYSNQTNKLSQVAKPLDNAVITKDEAKGTDYGTGTELQSSEQIEKYRSDESQPLYLRSYISIPDIGLNTQIFEGTSNRVLSYGAGTINPGQSPEKIGNYALAAHNYADWYYGSGFSKLQLYYENLNGINAYLTDGDNIYTYKLVDSKIVPREVSMDYVEDEFSNKELSESVKEYGNKTETVKIDDDEYTFGRLLTLYTCYELPPDYYMSYDRIIIRGVQTNSVKFEDAPNDIKQLFLIDNSNSNDSDKIGITNVNTNKNEEHKNIIDSFLNKQLSTNTKFVEYLFFISLGLVVLVFIVLIIIK